MLWSGKAIPKQTQNDTAEDPVRPSPKDHEQGQRVTATEGDNQRRNKQGQGHVVDKKDHQACEYHFVQPDPSAGPPDQKEGLGR